MCNFNTANPGKRGLPGGGGRWLGSFYFFLASRACLFQEILSRIKISKIIGSVSIVVIHITSLNKTRHTLSPNRGLVLSLLTASIMPK